MKLLLAAAAVALAGTSAHALTVSQNFDPVVVVDAGDASRTVSVNRSLVISDLDVILDLTGSGDGIDASGNPTGNSNAYPNELSFLLASPSGTQARLIAASTFTNVFNSFRVTLTLDDEAAAGFGSTPATGTFRPYNPLSIFDGEDAFGLWTVTIIDTTNADPKSLNAVTLSFNGGDEPVNAAVPLPAALPLMGLGLGALGFTARRRRA